MALTAQQLSDARRYAGYPAKGTDIPTDDSRDMAYGWVSPGVMQTLEHRLTHLTAEAEATLVSVYLTQLPLLEADVYGTRGNLDTKQAAVWTWNENEIGDRTTLYNKCRRDMCGFLGIRPGPALDQGGRIVRG